MAVVKLPTTVPGLEGGIVVVKGSNKTVVVQTNLDLTGATATLEVRRSELALDTLVVIAGEKQPPLEEGLLNFNFLPGDTSSLGAGIYFFSVRIDSPLLGILEFARGEFKLEPFDQAFVGRLEPILTLGIVGSTERIYLEIRDHNGILANPDEVRVQALDPHDNTIFDYSVPASQVGNPQGGIFFVDVASSLPGDVLVIWTTRFSGEEPVKTIKNVRFVSTGMFRIIPDVRMYIDKARKASDKTIAFNPADVALYIQNSLRDFNVQPPTTNLQLESFPDEYKELLIIGAVIQSLIAQGLLAVDQDFQYNDNGISLLIDHNTKLMGWFGQLMSIYTAKKRLVKMNFFTGSVYARTVVGQAFAASAAKAGPGTLTRFRGWI